MPRGVSAGWYRNSGPAILCENCNGWTLKIVWENSYIYQYPGTDPLYWYAQIKYINTGSKTLNITCDANPDPSAVKEYMSGTPNAGYVAADETFCTRNPGQIVSLNPDEALDDWAIFHNVPWPGGKVSLEDDYYGSSAWVDPWGTQYPAVAIPPPAVCPSELVTLEKCLPVLRQPRGKDSTASNLIVIAHGCCTTVNQVLNEWDQLGRTIGARLLADHPYGSWELVVLDWTNDAGQDCQTNVTYKPRFASHWMGPDQDGNNVNH